MLPASPAISHEFMFTTTALTLSQTVTCVFVCVGVVGLIKHLKSLAS